MTRDDKSTEVGTTGHEWDGIEELNNPLPRWWLWILYATIAWGLWYVVAYPALPGLKGYLGFSTRAKVAAEIAQVDQANAALTSQLETVDLTTLEANPTLHQFAVNGGAAVFRANCSQCHGSGASGSKGYPNLLDDDWIWGATIDEIAFTVRHGIRNEQSAETRWSEMPAFGEILEKAEVDAVVQTVLAMSGQEADAGLAKIGETVFADNCSACHGEKGEGSRDVGAPSLNDAIWLYGGDVAAVTETVTKARFGVMPAWSREYRAAGGLSDAQVNAVAAYVHQLGGGE